MDVLNRLSEFFEKSSAGKALTRAALEQEEQTRVAARAADVATIARVTAEIELEHKQSATKAARLRAEEDALRAQLAAASDKRAAFESAWRTRVHQHGRVLDQCRGRLERSANTTLINSFLQSLQEQDGGALYDHAEALTIDGKSTVVWDNRAAVDGFRAAVDAARQAARALQYEALDNVQLAARLAALQETLPAIDAKPDHLRDKYRLVGQSLASRPPVPPWRPDAVSA